MDINATFIGQIIVFLIMLWFIAKVVVPMIADPINKRYAKNRRRPGAADAGQKQLQAASASADRSFARGRERASSWTNRRSAADRDHRGRQAGGACEGARLLAAAQPRVGNEERARQRGAAA